MNNKCLPGYLVGTIMSILTYHSEYYTYHSSDGRWCSTWRGIDMACSECGIGLLFTALFNRVHAMLYSKVHRRSRVGLWPRCPIAILRPHDFRGVVRSLHRSNTMKALEANCPMKGLVTQYWSQNMCETSQLQNHCLLLPNLLSTHLIRTDLIQMNNPHKR